MSNEITITLDKDRMAKMNFEDRFVSAFLLHFSFHLKYVRGCACNSTSEKSWKKSFMDALLIAGCWRSH
jgi:hypothetical protein